MVLSSHGGSSEDSKVSLVVGSGGQDGYYLVELLRGRGDHVIEVRRSEASSSRLGRLGAVDILDRASVASILADFRPNQIYYLAASHGAAETAVEDPYRTFQRCYEVHVLGWLNFVDGVDRQRLASRLFYAASSHVFGDPLTSPQTEHTPLAPVCMYGITKSAGIGLCRYYRASRGVFCSAGILFNHESPRRPMPFVSRKIVRAAVDIKLGAKRTLTLGSLDAAVDWGAAEDYVEAMSRILLLDRPADFVIASGRLRTVRDFVEAAFSAVDLSWKPYVVEEPSLLRGVDRALPLCGDPTRLRKATGWQPCIDFAEMVRRMVAAELRSRENGAA